MKKRTIKLNLNNSNTITMSQALENYILDCKARNLAHLSIVNYTKCIKHFINIVGDIELSNLTIEDVNNFSSGLIKQGNSNNSVINYIKWLKTILIYNKVDKDLLDSIRRPKRIKKEVDILSPDEIKKLMKKPTRKTYTAFRDYTITNMILGTGVRCNTVPFIKWKDISFKQSTMLLTHTKTKKQYYIPLGSTMKKTLQEWYNICPHNSNDDYVFCTLYGDPTNREIIKKAVERFTIERLGRRYGTHIFRRTFASSYLASSGNLIYLQKLLGHEDIESTQLYVRSELEEIQQDYDNYNVLDQSSRKGIKLK